MKKKQTLISILVIVVALSGVTYFVYSSRTSPAPVIESLVPTSLIYKNNEYGFDFSLPLTWQGYSIIKNTWEGNNLNGAGTKQVGTKLLIRNPKWTEAAPYEDLPILVFTIAQWDSYVKGDFAVSAAPILASELGRNNVYVFALPPRWNFDYSLDYEEAGSIIAGKALQPFTINPPAQKNEALGPKNATYTINGEKVTLSNGITSTPAVPGSASKITTTYFGNEVTHDFDKDGRPDTAFLLTQETGGSGIFYYLVVALNTTRGYVGSDALLLGDRIAPQSTQMSQNKSTPDVIVVNYASRKPGEAFTVKPSVGKSMWVKLDTKTMRLGEVAINFEGEADTSKMTLTMQTWNWVKTTYNNNTVVTPRTSNKFTITFKSNSEKTFSAGTDCNSIGGEYIVTGNKIALTQMVSTTMYCESSQEGDFIKMLGEAESFQFTTKGELILTLKNNRGSMIFK